MAAGGGSIKLFKFIEKTYQDNGIVPPEFNQIRSPINWKNLFLLFSLAICFTSSATYLLFEANSMFEYGMTFFTGITVLFCFFLCLISLWQMKNILTFIENCERFIEMRTHSTVVYKNTNEKIEWLTGLLAYTLLATNIIIVLLPLLYTIVSYYFLDLGEESFFLFFLTWLPFDWKTPFGYSLAWLLQCTGATAGIKTTVPFFSMVFGSSWLFIVFAKDITNDVVAFNNIVKILKDKVNDRAELMDRFCNIVQHYSVAKQLINDFNGMYEYLLFVFFSWNMLSISSCLMTIQFQLWDDDSKLFPTMILSDLMFWVFINNLAICELGERVTDHFDQFGTECGRCKWNKLPIEMQKMYLIFISDTQQPKHIRTYGGIECTRETFKKIVAKGFSYFMALLKFRE